MSNDNLFIYTLQPQDEGKKIGEILFRRFHFSHNVIQKLKIGENVWVDNHFVFLTTRGCAGQTLKVNVQGSVETTSMDGLLPENLPIQILFEDNQFLAVNKPVGQVIHPIGTYKSGTLANAVLGYWAGKGESRLFRAISRIDRNTSGIVLIAKNRFAHQQIVWQSNNRLVEKKYLGIVQGRFPLDEGEFSDSIRLQSGSWIVRECHPEGQNSLTLYKTLHRFDHYTLMEFTLVTGRTHQIRVHCQEAGYPLLGDDLYGGNLTYINRQALHCYSYTFVHPLNEQKTIITASLPDDMRSLIGSSTLIQKGNESWNQQK